MQYNGSQHIYDAIDSKVFEQIKDCKKASEVWMRLEETYEGTPVTLTYADVGSM